MPIWVEVAIGVSVVVLTALGSVAAWQRWRTDQGKDHDGKVRAKALSDADVAHQFELLHAGHDELRQWLIPTPGLEGKSLVEKVARLAGEVEGLKAETSEQGKRVGTLESAFTAHAQTEDQLIHELRVARGEGSTS